VAPAVYVPTTRTEIRLAQAAPGGTGGTGGRPGGGGAGQNPGTGASGIDAGDVQSDLMEGAINLNTAPLEVLESLPQMTDPVAQAIVDYRTAQPFQSRGDLLQVPQVTQTLFNAVIEKVTVVSDSYSVRVLGMGTAVSAGSGRPSDLAVHLTATLDRSTGRCRIVRLRQDN
jgi:hypothetical protein